MLNNGKVGSSDTRFKKGPHHLGSLTRTPGGYYSSASGHTSQLICDANRPPSDFANFLQKYPGPSSQGDVTSISEYANSELSMGKIRSPTNTNSKTGVKRDLTNRTKVNQPLDNLKNSPSNFFMSPGPVQHSERQAHMLSLFE